MLRQTAPPHKNNNSHHSWTLDESSGNIFFVGDFFLYVSMIKYPAQTEFLIYFVWSAPKWKADPEKWFFFKKVLECITALFFLLWAFSSSGIGGRPSEFPFCPQSSFPPPPPFHDWVGTVLSGWVDSGHYYVCHSFLPASVPEWTQWMGMGVRGDEGEKALYLDTAPTRERGRIQQTYTSK